MLGSGPARPVLNSEDGEIDFAAPNGSNEFKGAWGGNKILWAVAPGTGQVTVTGRELSGDGQLRFGGGEHPKPKQVLAASPDASGWSDFPGFTRVRNPGCYVFEVTAADETQRIVFRFR